MTLENLIRIMQEKNKQVKKIKDTVDEDKLDEDNQEHHEIQVYKKNLYREQEYEH